MTCFFIGHRMAPESLYPRLWEAVLKHIEEYGVTEFVVGHYGQFDRMAASAVREVKRLHPEVTLTLLLPYYPFSFDALEYDSSFYPPGMETVPKPFAITRANRYMLRHCKYLICYYNGTPGNTRTMLEEAKRREKTGELTITQVSKQS